MGGQRRRRGFDGRQRHGSDRRALAQGEVEMLHGTVVLGEEGAQRPNKERGRGGFLLSSDVAVRSGGGG
jgi:hypothetical protein